MREDIYDLLNDVEIDLSEFEKGGFTEIERKKIMKKFRGSIRTNIGYKKYVGVVATLVISVSSISVFAGTNQAMRSIITDFLGIEKNLESYTAVVNKGITKGDVTIQLNEVILDEKELIVSTMITNKKPIEEVGIDTMASVYINGKRTNWGAGGGSRQVDDYTVEEVMHYQLDEAYTGEMDITLLFDDVRVNDVKQEGPWKFEFSTNGKELVKQTISKEINQVFTLPDQTNITFTRYTVNDVGEKIYFMQSKAGASYDLMLKGTDDMGNPVVFYLAYQKGTEGVLKPDMLSSTKDESASSYTLQLYAVKFPEESGKLSDDFEKIGNAFTITF